MQNIGALYDVATRFCHSEQREESLRVTLRRVYPEQGPKAQGNNTDLPIL
jgi:hypothetical protein